MSYSELRRLAATFSPAVFKALARNEVGNAARRVAQLLNPNESDSTLLADAFERAHARLVAAYPSEYSFKNQIVSKLILGKHSPSTASALLEQPMGSSIADVLVLNGTSTVYEVKTDLDSFARLPMQLMDYNRHAEYVYVVVSEQRALQAEKLVPEPTGILALRRSGALSTVRPALSNLPNLLHEDLFRLLRTAEAKSLIYRLAGYQSTAASGHLRDEVFQYFGALSSTQAHAAVVEELKGRGESARRLLANAAFPSSLRALAYGTELSSIGTTRLEQRLYSPVKAVLSTI